MKKEFKALFPIAYISKYIKIIPITFYGLFFLLLHGIIYFFLGEDFKIESKWWIFNDIFNLLISIFFIFFTPILIIKLISLGLIKELELNNIIVLADNFSYIICFFVLIFLDIAMNFSDFIVKNYIGKSLGLKVLGKIITLIFLSFVILIIFNNLPIDT